MFSDVHSHRTPTAVITIPMFSMLVRGFWFLLLAGTLVSELVPLSLAFEAQFSTLTFHSYEVVKLITFFVFGFLTPLAWWRYNTLGVGVLFAVITTAAVELGQAFIPGHRTSAIELGVKLVLLLAGFAAALDFRKYQHFNAGPLSVRFSSRYW
jgi:hypothetical protein